LERRIYRTPAAAKYLDMSESTLEKGRLTGTGPRFVRLGPRAVGYTVEDLDAYIDAGRRTSTSDDGTNLSDPAKPIPAASAVATPRGERPKRVTAAPQLERRASAEPQPRPGRGSRRRATANSVGGVTS
jgi:predicted DNA-binding transcriptional regulator AlpA